MSRKWLVILFAALAVPALLAVTASAQSPITFTTAAVGTSGVTGSGSISPGATGESTMNAQWQGLAPGSHHMVSQYHGTSCAAYDAAPEFVFTEVMADSQGKAAALITVKKPFANWPNRPHFLILHATEAPASAAIACGMIVAQASPRRGLRTRRCFSNRCSRCALRWDRRRTPQPPGRWTQRGRRSGDPALRLGTRHRRVPAPAPLAFGDRRELHNQPNGPPFQEARFGCCLGGKPRPTSAPSSHPRRCAAAVPPSGTCRRCSPRR